MKKHIIKFLYNLMRRIDYDKAYPLLCECGKCGVLLPTIIMREIDKTYHECYKCYKDGKYAD